MEMLALQSQTLFSKGMLIPCAVHFEYIGRWTFCLIEHCKLECRRLKKATAPLFCGILVAV